MMWNIGDSGIITLTPSKKMVALVLLFTFMALVSQMVPAHAIVQTVTLTPSNIVTQAGYYALLNATCTAPTTATFVIDGAHFQYNSATSMWEAHVRSTAMGVHTYNSLDSFTSGGDTANLVGSATVTWTQNPVDSLTVYTWTGDLTGLIYYFATTQLGGVTLTWTLIMAAISVAAYNYSGPEVTLLFWLLGWSVFSGLVYGGAQAFGILVLVIGGGALFAQVILGRRDRY
jgi:hypothetical protein